MAGTFGGKLICAARRRNSTTSTRRTARCQRRAWAFLWTPHWQTTVSYARSVTGNLGTELETARLDHYGPRVNWLLGGASGHVAPPSSISTRGIDRPAPQLREGYLGISKSFARSDWSIVGDYMKVAGERRITLTLVCTLHSARSGSLRRGLPPDPQKSHELAAGGPGVCDGRRRRFATGRS